jgi:IclR family mhp operon transcriptional activator
MKRVQALARGLRVLQLINAAPGSSLHDLARHTGFAKATLLRSLRTLEDAGFVARRLADGSYLPAGFATEPAARSAQWLPLTKAAGPSLRALGQSIPWPTDLGVRDGLAMLVLESNRRLSSIAVNRHALGVRPHMLWSAMGRAHLAWCPEAEREEILDRLRASKSAEDRPARNRIAIARLLRDTRIRGYAVRDPRYGVLDVGSRRRVSAIAVPVCHAEQVLACINCVWLLDVQSEAEVVRRHLPALKGASAEIAARILA